MSKSVFASIQTRAAYLERKRARSKWDDNNLKLDAFTAYGGVRCACCGESEMAFLSIDHIKGGGGKHRRSIGSKGGCHFYWWLAKNNYPKGYRVLCHNCNQASVFGPCPHQIKEV